MARLLAIEWDNREARVALATTRGSNLVVDDTFSVALEPREEGEHKLRPDPEFGAKLNSALAARQIKRGDVLVAVGRSGIELKRLLLPPVPDEELPDIVRLQATREFHSLGDDWPLDFLPLGGPFAEVRTVLAAAIAPELVGQIQDGCQAAGLTAQRLVLRPCAAASLFLRQGEARAQKVRLLVDLLREEADLTVLVDGDMALMRTVRLPTDVLSTPEGYRPLLAEIRRTLAAAHNQEGIGQVEAIYLCGTPAEHAAIAERMGQDLGIPARLFDPFSGLELGPALSGQPPAHRGRFAPLLGMLADAAEGVPQAIDFLNPRRRPVPKSRRPAYLMAGAAATAIALAAFLWISRGLAALDAEVVDQRKKLQQLEAMVKQADRVEKSAAEIQRWANNDIVWLDELRELALELPEAKDAMLTILRCSPHPEGGAIALEAMVSESSVIDDFEHRLRDKRHRVEGQNRQLESGNKQYSWRFNSSVVVKPRVEAAASDSPLAAAKGT